MFALPGSLVAVVLTIFYLYLAVRSDRVNRPILYWLGALSLAAAMILACFLVIDNSAVQIIFSILMQVLVVISFLLGLGAAFGGDLPVQITGQPRHETQPGEGGV